MNFESAQIAFNKYVINFNVKDGPTALKIRHTYEVVKKSEYIAIGLGLDKDDIELAKIIALLHDIGRFEQIKEYNNFNDDKMDHAQYGVKILFEDNLIRNFIETDKYNDIIYKAIFNHNKFQIEENLNEIELLHCKIIRDADKLDNFRVKKEERFEDMFPNVYNSKTAKYENITPKIYEDFMNHKCIKLEDRKTMIDYWICIIAFIFDLNFDVSLKYIKENNYIDILIDRLEYKNNNTKQKMEDIRKCAKDYLDFRC